MRGRRSAIARLVGWWPPPELDVLRVRVCAWFECRWCVCVVRSLQRSFARSRKVASCRYHSRSRAHFARVGWSGVGDGVADFESHLATSGVHLHSPFTTLGAPCGPNENALLVCLVSFHFVRFASFRSFICSSLSFVIPPAHFLCPRNSQHVARVRRCRPAAVRLPGQAVLSRGSRGGSGALIYQSIVRIYILLLLLLFIYFF